MKRVLVMASTFPRWEGDTVPPFVFQLSERLAESGYEMHVLAPHAEGAAREEEMGQLRVHRFRYAPSSMETLAYGGGILENLKKNPLRWALVPGFLAAQTYSTWRLMKKYRYDLLHVHWLIPQGLSAAVLPAWIDTPKLLTAHGGDVFASTTGIRKGIVKFVSDRHDAVTVNSTAMGKAVHDLTGHESTVIPMGVDLEAFSNLRQQLVGSEGGRTPQILFVGRLAEKKGVEYLIRAMPAIRSSVPGVKLVIVGDGPNRQMLEQEAIDAGVQDSVRFEGARPNSELPSYYSSADVFVAPSVVAESGDTEALGVVFLEAAGCGLPIVSTRVGGISDVIKHNETGLLVEQKSPAELATAVTALLKDRSRANFLGTAARRHVADRFGWDDVAARFAQVYDQLIVSQAPSKLDVPEQRAA